MKRLPIRLLYWILTLALFFSGVVNVPSMVKSAPAQIFQRLGAINLGSFQGIDTLAVDPAGGFAYIGNQGNPGSIQRVRLADFVLDGTLSLQTGERDVRKLLLDPAGGYLYAALENPGRVIRVRLSDFTRQEHLDLESGETGLQASVIDLAAGYLYLGTDTFPAKVIRIRLSDLTRQGSLTLPAGDDNLLAAALDPARGYLYLTANVYPAKIIRVNLDALSYQDELVFPEGEDYFTCLAVDEPGGLAYLATGNKPAAFVKVDLNSFTRLAGTYLDPGDQYIRSIILDSAHDAAYLAAYTDPGRVIQMRLSDLSTAARVILNTGEGYLNASAGDIAGQEAYFADTLDSASLVKVELATPAARYGSDLGLSLLQAPASGQVGEPLVYSFQVSNLGQQTAAGVQFSSSINAGSGFRRLNPSQGICQANGLTMTCSLGTLVPGAGAQVELEVRPGAGASLGYTASIMAGEYPDPQVSNNSLAGSILLAPAGHKIHLPFMTGGISAPPPEIIPAPRIRLETGAAGLAPGENLTLSWQAQDAANTGLELSVITPGRAITNTDFLPGAIPANGTRYYLTSQHTWQITPTLVISPAVAGSLQVGLPGSAEGEYAFTASLKDSGKTLLSASSVSVLASWSPAIFLHAAPGVYHPGSPVQVELLTAAGGSNPGGEQTSQPAAQTGKLIATLTLNDGTQLALPSFSPGQTPLLSGPLQNARYQLLEQSLAFYGDGGYQLQAAFVNDQQPSSPVYLGLAEMSLEVCSAPAALSGTFRDANGSPLGGGSPDLAQVRLVNVLDGTIHNLITPGADGTFSISALPGIYQLTGEVLAGGLSYSASAPAPFELGCAATVQMDLQAGPAVPGLASDKPQTSRNPGISSALELSPNASDGLPRPNIYLTTVDGANLGPLIGNVTEIFSGELWKLQRDNIHLMTQADLAGFMELEYWRQMSGSQISANASKDALDAMGGANFNIGLKAVRSGAGYRVEVTLTLPDGTILRRVNSDFNQQSLTPQLIKQAASRLNFFPNDTKRLPDLFLRMRAEQPRPIFPKLSVTVTPAVIQPNGSVEASLKLTDGNGELMPGKPVSLLHWPPGRDTSQSPIEISGVTNGSGVFTAQLPITATVGVGHVDGKFERGDRRWCVMGLICSGAVVYTAQQPSSLNLSSSQQVVRQGQAVQVCAVLTNQGQPAANRTLQLAVSGGSLPQGAVMVTNADGKRCFPFMPGSGALAQIEASSNNPLATGRIAFQVLGALQQGIGAAPSQIQTGATSGVTVETKIGTSAVPGAPAAFSLNGPGTISVRNTTTNSLGKAATVYTAPQQSAAGSATITSIVYVGSQIISSTVTVSFQPAACQAPVGMVCYDVLPVNGITPYALDDSNVLWGVGGGIGPDPEIASWNNGSVSSLGTVTKPAFFNYIDIVDVAPGGYTALAGSPHPRGQDCSGLCTYALRWSPGTGTETMQPSGSWDRPLAIDASGKMAGWTHYLNRWPAIWNNAANPPQMTYTVGLSNGFGPIAFDGSKIAYNSANQLYTWSPGSFHAAPQGVNMIPLDMSPGGTIVGVSGGIAYSTGAGSLGTLGGGNSEAFGVNNAGVVVGWSSLSNGLERGFIYKNNKMYNLSQLVDFVNISYIERAYEINNNGWVLVSGPQGYALLKPR